MDRNRFQTAILAAVLLVLVGVSIVVVRLDGAACAQAVVIAQEGSAVERSAAAVTTPAMLQYQGRLSHPGTGEPVADGTYTMVLRLYDKPTGGKSLWMEAKDVPVQNGLFSTVLGDTKSLKRELFDGRALWLGIKVGSDPEAAPQQQVLPVAYALGLAPGAEIQANSGTPALSVSNAGAGEALHAGGAVVVDGNLTINGKLKGSHASDPDAHHARYTDQEALAAVLSSPEIITQYEFEDHVYGGMHYGRAIAFGSITPEGTIATSSGNVSSRWNNLWKGYEITIDGHTYDWHSYVTVVTPVTGGIANTWSNGGKMVVGIYQDAQSPGMKAAFHFVTFQP
jgi:hypothetical protein